MDSNLDLNLALDNVINYIEENICSTIDYQEAAGMVGASIFHFQRIFSFLTGIPIAEYIRCRKMTLAAFDLQKTDAKIIDIASKYGYESQSSFTRAFQQFHGITPFTARKEGARIQVYPKMHLRITVKGTENIEFRIEKTAGYQVFGKNDTVIPMEQKDALEYILAYGNKVVEDGTHNAINIAAGFQVGEEIPFHLLHGIYFKDKTDNLHFMYGWELPEKGVSKCFTIVDIPETSWAVFTYHGEHSKGLPAIWTYLYTNWFATSGYETEDYIFIEKETWLDEQQERFVAEVWIPLSK